MCGRTTISVERGRIASRGTMARGRDMPGLSAIAMRRLLAEGEYSVPIAVGDLNAGAQYCGRL
jgi:hypothetical protein